MSVNNTRVNISIPIDVLEKLDNICKKLGCTRSSYIVTSLYQKFQTDTLVERLPEVLKAVEDLKNLNTISPEDLKTNLK